MVALRHLGIVATLLLGASLTGRAQLSRADFRPDLPTATWLAAVRDHQAGIADSPLAAIAEWPKTRVAHVLGKVCRPRRP
ncbi:MAG: hypothetical protein ABIT71_19250 [Vicinamibacteraceae bacterium]